MIIKPEDMTAEDKIDLAIATAYTKELNEKVFRKTADECAAKILMKDFDKRLKERNT
jgi:hypothetical protein